MKRIKKRAVKKEFKITLVCKEMLLCSDCAATTEVIAIDAVLQS